MKVVKTDLLVRQLGKDNSRVILKWLETTIWDLKNRTIDVDEDQATLREKWKARAIRQLAADLKAVIDAG